MPPPDPERVEGPTPAGGAYAVLYRDEQGVAVELVEYAANGEALQRTYLAAAEPGVEDPGTPGP